VLPGTYYLIRMLDGRIDIQGLVTDLRAQGVIKNIAQDETVQVQEERQVSSGTPVDPATEVDVDAKLMQDTRKPRKLIKDEAREHGAVKWSIYNTYLQASCVPSAILCGTMFYTRALADRTGHG
jgi:hypothetical protein